MISISTKIDSHETGSHNLIGSDQPRILIVDDDPDILSSLRDVLELEIDNCIIDLANGGKQAELLAQQARPDVVLLDIKLGQDDGLELVPVLRSIYPDIACVMMTAYRDSEYTVRAVRFGANDYLYKPIKATELILIVKRLLQQQRLIQESASAKRRFHIIFEQAIQWLFVVNKEGSLIDVNQAALNLYEKDKSSVIGEALWNTQWWKSSPNARESIRSGLAKAIAGELSRSEIVIFDSEQNKKTLILSMNPVIDEEAGTTQIVVECRDITRRKKANDEIRRLNLTLDKRVKERTEQLEQSILLLKNENQRRKTTEGMLIKAKEEAERANTTKSEFLSRMSHELRTPMNAILGFAQLLMMDAERLSESQQDNTQEILDAGHHLLSLINEVLDLAKIESGKLEVYMEKIHVDGLLSQCMALIGAQAKARKLELIDNISGKGYVVQADFIRLKQILLNLLSNAVKYNREQGQLTLDDDIIDNQRLRICVTDTGEGLTEDEITRLFTTFERLNAINNVEGAGIGLVITKHLVEAIGGSIGVESTPGEGCTFWIELELAKNV